MATILGLGISILEILVVLNLIAFLGVLGNFEAKTTDEIKPEISEHRKNIHETERKNNLDFRASSQGLKFKSH